MSRSSDIVSQIQKRRADRKKPKINAQLKKVSIDESQKGGIAAAQENKPPPMTVQKTGGRNSFALTVSVGLHVAIALLLGFLVIKNQITSTDDKLAAALIPPELPKTKRVFDIKRPRVTFEAKEQVVEAPMRSTPVTNTKIPNRPGDSTLPTALDTDLSTVGSALSEGPKLSNIGAGLARPIQPTQQTIAPTFERPTNQGGPIVDINEIPEPTDGPTLVVPDIDTSKSGITPPQTIKKVKPVYPKDAKRAEKQGTVTLRAIIGTDGTAKNITALTSLGFGFEDAAIAALKKFKFIPAKKNGVATELAVQIPFEFKLDDE